ncbi:MAG: cation transporter [Idiomarinaceae bacterium]|uniref:cation diffusion facilitator family transporter n=1 Tax=Idiomarina sp. 28-8 TaxID=1260624 RepID=UPI00030A11C2|nr:cation diffusion facilitator family transporter [Idiomarina sp. 28-8]NWO01417.1 cation transporter [Idiomarinaceae bacterium]
MSSCCGSSSGSNVQAHIDKAQRRLLWTVLVLNGVMFFVEFIAGWLAESSGLIADSLDMLADTLVYAVSLYAVGKAIKYKANAAIFNGTLQTLLALLVLADVFQRLAFGSEPNANMMLWVAGLALVVNVACFALLYSSRNGDINIRASWICSRNDMIMNVGVIVSALLVAQLNTAWPDLVIATVIAIIVLRSAIRIIKDAIAVKAGEKTDISGCCG